MCNLVPYHPVKYVRYTKILSSGTMRLNYLPRSIWDSVLSFLSSGWGFFWNSKSVQVKNYRFFALLSTLFNHEVFGLKELSLNTIGLENIN